MNRTPRLTRLVAILATLPIAACAADGDPEREPIGDLDPEYGKPVLDVDDSAVAKADSFDGGAGPVAGTFASTAVWKVTRRWYEKDAAAGIAWPADSSFTWDEKFARWVDSLERVDGLDRDTVQLTTPWGKSLPAPKLECAEAGIFLRATFASWYGLPFYMAAGSQYFGHFGIVDKSGARIAGFPRFATDYKDHTSAFAGKSNADIVASWPHDTKLRARYLTAGKDDDNTFLGDGLYSGAYFDEIFLNKRTGHFMLRLLTYFGSMHLVSGQNTFNIRPTAIREGDMLLERWQRQGIGHTIIVRDVERLEGGKMAITTVFGSMPRVQPMWYEPALSASYFTSQLAGGEGTNWQGDKYAALGGGAKRWRTPVIKNGRWYNIVPQTDRTAFVDAADLVAIAKRPAEFGALLGALDPTDARDALLARIEVARETLRQRPASCTNRQRREEAFSELYTLSAEAFDLPRDEVDRAYRVLDDYVLPELSYGQSKTCCWNHTTAEMYLIIMQMNEERVRGAATGQCVAPIPFEAKGGGYQVFADYAASIGQSAAWVAWTEDEPCAQRAVIDDTEVTHAWTDFCAVRDDVLTNTSDD